MYYVNDGVYGSFNCLVFDHATVTPEVFGTDEKAEKFPSSIWGPTCDSLDCITKNVLLPKVCSSFIHIQQQGPKLKFFRNHLLVMFCKMVATKINLVTKIFYLLSNFVNLRTRGITLQGLKLTKSLSGHLATKW